MTCIAGYRQDGQVWIGGDAMASNSEDYRLVKAPKVFRKKRNDIEMIIGYAGCFRKGQIIQYALELSDMHKQGKMSNMKYISTVFADAVYEVWDENSQRVCFDENGNDDATTDLLIGFKGELFILEDDYSVYQHDTNYESIGIGRTPALACFSALEDIMQLIEPADKVERALEVSSQFSKDVRPPFTILEL